MEITATPSGPIGPQDIALLLFALVVVAFWIEQRWLG